MAEFRKPQARRSKSSRVAMIHFSRLPSGRFLRRWRHRFKTVGIEHRILDAIQGHRPRNVAEGYGEVTIKTQAGAIAKLPRYRVS